MLSSFRPAQKDIELVQPPTDSVSDIEFAPTQPILAVASWDNNVGAIPRVQYCRGEITTRSPLTRPGAPVQRGQLWTITTSGDVQPRGARPGSSLVKCECEDSAARRAT
jgi:mRNA export factor